jgi:hypothetical protein
LYAFQGKICSGLVDVKRVDVLVVANYGLPSNGVFQLADIPRDLSNNIKCRVLIMAVDDELDPNLVVHHGANSNQFG